LIKIIIGGGDSSVIELVNILDKNKIDFKRCHFGVLPLGIANDLSAALRWGGILNNKIY
jgi:diacylglycerol kinase family enzyme